MKEVYIKVAIQIPEGIECTESEVREWVEFNIGSCGHIHTNNPLSDYDFEDVDLRDMRIY